MKINTVKDSSPTHADRDRIIIRTSVIGILANVFLAAFKAVIGLAVNSIAIVMDAVNNLSDAVSSVITIVGTKLAGKPADRKHPFGHGRAEHLSAMVISMLVLYAGVTAFIESVKKIIHPDTPDYSIAALVIVAVAVVVKIALGYYVRHIGETVNSDSLINSGEDARLDAIISASTLVVAIVYVLFHISAEAWLGAAISAFIIKSGIEMIGNTLSKILGERADAGLARAIKATVTAYPEVLGAYDLVMHNYGPDAFTASVHIEVADTLPIEELDRITREITMEVYHKQNVLLTAIGTYAVNTRDEFAAAARHKAEAFAAEDPYILELHGFRIDNEKKEIVFDIVISFDAPDRDAVTSGIYGKMHAEYPDFSISIIPDTDFSE